MAEKLQAQQRARNNPVVRGHPRTCLSGDATEEETKTDTLSVLSMKPFDKNFSKHTAFFTDYKPEEIFKQLVDVLNEKNLKPKISDKVWKLNFEISKNIEAGEEEKETFTERSNVQVELKDVGDSNTICVEFCRKEGSSMLFYDQYLILKDRLSLLNNVAI